MPKFAANLTMLYNELPFLDRFEAAAKDGFAGIEFQFPYDFDKKDIAANMSRYGLAMVLHNLPAGDWSAGERGLAILPERIGDFRDGVARAIDYAGTLGCKQLNCLAGVAPKGGDPERLRETLLANLDYAAKALKDAGIKLLIEAVNTRDVPGFFVSNSKDAFAIIDAVSSDNIFFQYDIYHMQRMEGELARTIEANLARIAHMQLADNPGRNEPGTGEINYPFLFKKIDAIGYSGWIGCEYKPATTTTEGLGWFAPYAKR